MKTAPAELHLYEPEAPERQPEALHSIILLRQLLAQALHRREVTEEEGLEAMLFLDHDDGFARYDSLLP